MSEQVMKAKALEEKGSVVLPFLKKLPETSQVTLHNSGLQGEQKAFGKLSSWIWACGVQGEVPFNNLEGFGAKTFLF